MHVHRVSAAGVPLSLAIDFGFFCDVRRTVLPGAFPCSAAPLLARVVLILRFFPVVLQAINP